MGKRSINQSAPKREKTIMKLEDQLNHPFYQEVEDYRNEIKEITMIKAANKYDEPFNPDTWSDDQLCDHGMMENFDQSVYITGMRNRIRKLRAEVEKYKKLYHDELTRGAS